jgi:hypothetical protein
VNHFIEDCRREWRRLRVPASVVNEMAAELEADLAEAAADGVSPEELLGEDPRSFAASWAAARGVGRPSRATKALLLAAIAAFLAVAITGAALALFAAPAHAVQAPAPRTLALGSAPVTKRTAVTAVWVSALPVPARASGGDTRRIGEVLLIIGLAGTAALSLLGQWRRSSPL